MSYHEARTDCRQRDSSSANLSVPHNARVKSAHLYWSASGSPRTSTLKATLNGNTLYADQKWTDSYSGYHFYGAMKDVTHLVSKSGEYTVSGLWYDNSGQLCQGNAAYAAWSLVVVYEEDSLPNARVNFCYDNFDFTFPEGSYSSDVECIERLDDSCSTNARTTVVTFESDDYQGEHFYLGGKYMGDNIFRGRTAPNLDIVDFDVSGLVNQGIHSLEYKVETYYVNSIYGGAIEGLFMPIRVLKYDREKCH